LALHDFVTTFHFLHSPDFYIIYIILLFRAAFIKQQCTFECTWSPPTPDNTAKPTLSPTTISQTHNHILLKLRELPEQYRITASIRHAIVEFVKGLIEKKMGYDLEILDVEWPGRLPSEPHSLPIDITAQGPTDVSQFSQPYILELLRENESDLIEYLKTNEGGIPFEYVGLKVDTYDPNDILAGDTEAPITSPTNAPIAMEDQVKVNAVIKEAAKVESDSIPWWVWLLLVILVLICCGGWCCLAYPKDIPYRHQGPDNREPIFYQEEISRRGSEPQEQQHEQVGRLQNVQ